MYENIHEIRSWSTITIWRTWHFCDIKIFYQIGINIESHFVINDICVAMPVTAKQYWAYNKSYINFTKLKLANMAYIIILPKSNEWSLQKQHKPQKGACSVHCAYMNTPLIYMISLKSSKELFGHV